MALICRSCRAENPLTNRFCGQCGTQLARATGIPEELEQIRAGSSAPMETARVAADAEHVRESRGEALRWNTAAAASTGNNQGSGNAVDGQASDNAVDGAPANSGLAEPESKYRFVIEGENTVGSGFLGLSDKGSYSYDDEEPGPSSHLGRNIAICLIAAAVSLSAWQWRSIRDYGLLLYSSISGQDESRAAAGNAAVPNASPRIAEDSSRTPAKADEPRAIESSTSADHARPVQQTERTQESATGDTSSHRSAEITSPRAMGSPVADMPESQSSGSLRPALQ